MHLPIEESKHGGLKGYFLGKQNFESLDEIIEEYIDHCNDVLYNKSFCVTHSEAQLVNRKHFAIMRPFVIAMRTAFSINIFVSAFQFVTHK